MPSQQGFHIGSAAKLLKLQPATLRFYESLGLIETHRSAAGFRLYSPEQIQRLKYIRLMRSTLCFSLTEIKEVLDLIAAGRRGFSRLQALLETQDSKMDQQIHRLRDCKRRLELAKDVIERAQAGSDELDPMTVERFMNVKLD